MGSRESKNDHAVNSSWRDLRLTNPLESANPLGILQSNACSGQNKGITVTRQENSTEIGFHQEKCGKLSELNTLALFRSATFPFLFQQQGENSYSSQKQLPKNHPRFLSRAVSNSKASGRFLMDVSYFGIR